jgi:predicted nucleic acid-binding protein
MRTLPAGVVRPTTGRAATAPEWSLASSARRIPDAILASTAAQARCDWIATFDEAFTSPTIAARLL